MPARVYDQPVEVAEVADRLAGLARATPAGRVPDMGGPEVRPLAYLAHAYLRATGRRRAVTTLPLCGATYRAFRRGEHLTPRRAVGKGTFEEYLERRFG